MAPRRKLVTFAEDLDQIRASAARLLSLQTAVIPMQWTDWELDFLDSMAGRDSDEPLSEAQVAKFAQLERISRLHSEVDGLSIRLLIARCVLDAEDLADEDDRSFVRDLRERGLDCARGRDIGRLLACCRELDVIETHHGMAA